MIDDSGNAVIQGHGSIQFHQLVSQCSGMKHKASDAVFQVTERGFNVPAHPINISNLDGREFILRKIREKILKITAWQFFNHDSEG